ncbi:LADA_0C05116g1_1 [Lachancea dasiensis]|uniref:LADA_0C05116g1_1 n=1 Tax=Lachancea dasiensis TaxID=1072105 RepID=A0A1G4IZ67_9SACH|nr:LADA_0C05116g1_1 [Lachancea dasiensis]
MSTDDEILEMFFDEQFMPLAYLDLLLSPDGPLGETHSMSSSLLSRLDLYTDRLTSQLESTVHNLRKPTELLSYTGVHTDLGDTTKLQYYLDTLSNSVKDLKGDIETVNVQLSNLKVENAESIRTTEALHDLNLVKSRLLQVSKCFEDLRAIAIASFEGVGKDEIPQIISSNEFKRSLKQLQDLLCTEFEESLSRESSQSRNEDLLRKLKNYEDLRPTFKT